MQDRDRACSKESTGTTRSPHWTRPMQQMLWTEFRWLHTENDWSATLLLAMRRRLAVCRRCTLRVSMSEDRLLPLVHEWNYDECHSESMLVAVAS